MNIQWGLDGTLTSKIFKTHVCYQFQLSHWPFRKKNCSWLLGVFFFFSRVVWCSLFFVVDFGRMFQTTSFSQSWVMIFSFHTLYFSLILYTPCILDLEFYYLPLFFTLTSFILWKHFVNYFFYSSMPPHYWSLNLTVVYDSCVNVPC